MAEGPTTTQQAPPAGEARDATTGPLPARPPDTPMPICAPPGTLRSGVRLHIRCASGAYVRGDGPTSSWTRVADRTMVLAKGLETVIHTVDVSEPLLADLKRRATEASLDHLLHTKCIAVADIPTPFQQVRRPSPIPHRRANGWMSRGPADLPGRCANRRRYARRRGPTPVTARPESRSCPTSGRRSRRGPACRRTAGRPSPGSGSAGRSHCRARWPRPPCGR
jgi:hypothetical protein